MESIVGILGKYGGDIIKFIGDAMIVMWPIVDKAQIGDPDYLTYLARKAVQCAVDVQIDLNNKKIMSNITNLSVKVSLGTNLFQDRNRHRALCSPSCWRSV